MEMLQRERDLHQRRADRRRRRLVGGHDQDAARAPHRLAGQRLDARTAGRKAAHPNARFTVAATQCPSLDPALGRPGRRADLARSSSAARRSRHDAARRRGVELGGRRLHGGDDGLGDDGRGRRHGRRGAPRSVRDAAVLRLPHRRLLRALARDGRARCAHPPRIFSVNWFRKDEDGKFVWPGFGQNMRVLKWIVERCEGTAKGRETALGIEPAYGDSTGPGLEFAPERFAQVIGVDVEAWSRELAEHDELFASSAKSSRRRSPSSAPSWGAVWQGRRRQRVLTHSGACGRRFCLRTPQRTAALRSTARGFT